MKTIKGAGLLAFIALAFLASQLWAGSPGAKPDRFPRGLHYSLNLTGRGDGFTCPAQESDTSENPIYGDVVFVPQNGIGCQIYMEYGNETHAATITQLQAIDPCGGFDGNGAVIQLPQNPSGYRVYARALVKPTSTPVITIIPKLNTAEDEEGNNLVYLGLVTNSGLTTVDGITISQPKGDSSTLNITGLFRWTGDVCYLKPPDDSYQRSQICGINQKGACAPPGNESKTTSPSVDPQPITTYCKEYADEWVFNISDFEEYLWSAVNNGVKLIQVWFYPNREEFESAFLDKSSYRN